MQIWVYSLMTRHIHLLALTETEIALSQGIGLTNQMYTQYLNRKLNLSGSNSPLLAAGLFISGS